MDGTGSCLFSALKQSMAVRTATTKDATYFPNQYFRHMVVNYMVNKRQLIYKNKFVTLMSLYSVEVEGSAGDRLDPSFVLQTVPQTATMMWLLGR